MPTRQGGVHSCRVALHQLLHVLQVRVGLAEMCHESDPEHGHGFVVFGRVASQLRHMADGQRHHPDRVVHILGLVEDCPGKAEVSLVVQVVAAGRFQHPQAIGQIELVHAVGTSRSRSSAYASWIARRKTSESGKVS